MTGCLEGNIGLPSRICCHVCWSCDVTEEAKYTVTSKDGWVTFECPDCAKVSAEMGGVTIEVLVPLPPESVRQDGALSHA